MNHKKLKIAIIGASGYTGSELARLLVHHPQVEIKMITSESHQGKPFSELHGQFLGILDLPLVSADEVENSLPLDFIFLALPHGVSMRFVEKWHQLGVKIIDFSGDFRLASPQVYEHWYKKDHTFPKGFENAVYGMPEFHREAIKTAHLVANPGCFPTASALGAAPLFHYGLADKKSLVIDAKTGTTGAGVKASVVTHYSNVNENFKAYGVKSHRHTVEIEEQLSQISGSEIIAQFTPHLLPVDRGILATIYASPKGKITEDQLREKYEAFYRDAPFVRIRKTVPTLKDVRGSNFCDIYPVFDERTGRIIVFSAIDNLVKGASGAAVQNMNLMAGLPETEGLIHTPINP